MTKLTDTRAITAGETIVGVFAREQQARTAMRDLERAGMPPDRIGIVEGNVRQAREVAGSYSPQGALAGFMLGALLIVGYIVFGLEMIRINPIGIALGAFGVLIGFTVIGWLAGRARVFKQDEYAHFENEVAAGDTLLSVVCDTTDGASTTRDVLKRAGATEVRTEESAESV